MSSLQPSPLVTLEQGVDPARSVANPASPVTNASAWEAWHASRPYAERGRAGPQRAPSSYETLRQAGLSPSQARDYLRNTPAPAPQPLNLRPRRPTPAPDPWSEYRRQQLGYTGEQWRSLQADQRAGLPPPLNLPPRQGSRGNLNPPPTPARGPAPVNSPSPGATVSAPRTANPGLGVNLRDSIAPGLGALSSKAGLASNATRGMVGVGAVFTGGSAAYSAAAEGGGFFEVGSTFVTGTVGAGIGTVGGALLGAAGVGALGTSVGSVAPGLGNAIGGGTGVLIGSGIGASAGNYVVGTAGARAGRAYGRFIDDLIPDLPLPWPFNGKKNGDYDNQLDPAAMGEGEQTSPLILQNGGPGSSPVNYSVTVFYSDEIRGSSGNWSPRYFTDTVTVRGPLQGTGEGLLVGANRMTVVGTTPEGEPMTVFTGLSGASTSGCVTSPDNFRNCNQGIASIVRLDGQEDPPYQPEQPPTYAPNPARTAPQGNPDRPWESPANLPAPPLPYRPLPTEDAPQMWPYAEPLDLGGPRLQPEPERPPTFEPSPNLASIPSAEPAPDPIPAGRPDLSPDAAPGSNPGADLATDPDTPTQPDPLGAKLQDAPEGGGLPRTFELADGTRVTENEDGSRTIVWPYGTTQEEAIRRSNPSPVIVPVMIPVGGRQTVTTPAWNLTNDPSQRPNPFTQQQTPRVVQSSSNPPRGVCRYEQQRVADIQRKATATEEMSSNPLSGFLGLYGLGIEARTKLGQTYDNTQQTKERIRPEDFPMLLPAQIADPNTAQVTINSLGELGVWIVKQLDGVAGKWPMEVPVPGVSQALAVPNMSEAIAEMFGMMISQQVTAAQILNTSSRTLAQAGSATQQAALANMIAKGNAEFLGYEAKPTAVDMPLTYTPGHDPGEGLLEESTAKIKGWENTDGTDLKQILSDLMHAAQIIKAVYWRRLDATGDFQAQIDQQIRGKSQWLDELGQRPTAQQAEDWEQYLRDVEQGFTTRTNDATPYGRNPTEGPQVRDVTPEPPTTP